MGEALADLLDFGFFGGELLFEVGDGLLGFFPEGSVFAGFGKFGGFGLFLTGANFVELLLEGFAVFAVFAALGNQFLVFRTKRVELGGQIGATSHRLRGSWLHGSGYCLLFFGHGCVLLGPL